MTRTKKTVSKLWYVHRFVLEHFDHLTFAAVFLSLDMQKKGSTKELPRPNISRLSHICDMPPR
jgi:hypothetical protein